jgi:hypothetical protein
MDSVGLDRRLIVTRFLRNRLLLEHLQPKQRGSKFGADSHAGVEQRRERV